MLGTKKINRTLSVLTGIALICASSISAAYAADDLKADITVNGQVTVNGQPAVSNSTVVSGSTVTTGSGSNAIIGLGGNGRVELSPETSLTLKFSDNSIVAMLTSGKVRLTNSAGIGTTVTTRSATVVADAGRSNTFSVDIGCGDDIKCSQTLVQTAAGLVTLKSGSTTKQVAAGTDAISGGSATGCLPCFRPVDDTETKDADVSAGGIGAIVTGIAAVAITAIIYSRENNGQQNGNVFIVSPQ